MRNEYAKILQTPAVEQAQWENYGKVAAARATVGEPGGLSEVERSYIEGRDSFYMASVSESGWPYLQHRGGAAGFLMVVGERRLAFLDYEGNRQMLSVGNVSSEDRVSLFLMDYRARERLKLLCRARCVKPEAEPEIFSRFPEGERARSRRLFVLEVEGYDWNCPKYITQRFTRAEVEQVTSGLRDRIQELEAALCRAREGR